MSEEFVGAILVIAPDGTIRFWNAAAEMLFGYACDEAVGRSLFDTIVPPEQSEGKRSWLAAVMETGSAVSEAVQCRKDGIRIWVDITARVVESSDGTRWLVLNERDITRIKYERDARGLQTRFRGVLEAAPDAIVLVDPDGRIALVNSEAERLFGYGRHELLGQLVELLVPNRFRDSLPSHRRAYFAEPRTRPMGSGLELSGRRKDGAEFPVEISLSPLSIDDTTLAMAAIRDVTARKKTEAKFRGLLEAAPDAMIIVNREGRIALVNSQAEQLFGYAPTELLGEPVEMLVPTVFHDDDAKNGKRYFTDPHRRPMGSGLELSARRKDGREIPVEISLSPVETEEGTLVTAAVRDISERLRLQEIRREVAERKAVEEALTRHACELARSNADLEQFAYVASHDLQEPLRMVANYTQLLAKRYRGRLDADADEFIDYVVDGAARMQQLITDLLAYSRVGTTGKSFAVVDCEAVFTRVLGTLKLAIKQSAAVVTHDPLPTLVGDETQLEQLFQNLVGNALKFRGREPARVHVGAERNDAEWKFAVRDNGIGIPPEHIERIGLAFQRLHSKAEYPGTGIGLAISKKIVERHDGRMWVESKPGSGATFYFTLPVLPAGCARGTGA